MARYNQAWLHFLLEIRVNTHRISHTLYGLNIIAWGAMLFFLLLSAAPAMNHPSKNSNDSPSKKWIEIDSQIPNALFCVTGFGLASWRYRDLWWLWQARLRHNKHAMQMLEEQNRSWFRPPAWFESEEEQTGQEKRVTFTGEASPATKMWKLSFVVWMMVLNTLFKCVLASMMWGYISINRPSWSTGCLLRWLRSQSGGWSQDVVGGAQGEEDWRPCGQSYSG